MGSAILDMILYTRWVKKKKVDGKDYLLIPHSSKTEIERLEVDAGGSGHNVAVGLSKLENKVMFLGAVGNDQNGDIILSNFKKNNVDVNGIKILEDGMTGLSMIIISPDREKTILTYRGANDSLGPEDVQENYLKNVKWFVFTSLLSNNSIEAVRKTIQVVKKNGGKILANPSLSMVKHRRKDFLELVKDCDIVIMNKEEVCELFRTRDERKALKKLSMLGVKSIVVTLGKNGLIASDKNSFYKKNAFKVRILDTTGAGDGFTAGFLHWLVKTNSFEDALDFGSATAALNMESIGATKNLPSEKDIINLMRR